MIADSVSFRGHRCFKKEWAGFDSTKPINVIIGRNNTGKSHLLDLAAALCEGKLEGRGWRYRCRGVLDEGSLKPFFQEHTSEGELRGNHWRDHGLHFVGVTVTWEMDEQANATELSFHNGFDPNSRYGERSTTVRLAGIREAVKRVSHKLSGSVFRRLLADRDIRPEAPDNHLSLSSDGVGATNIMRRYIVTSNPQFPREISQRYLLSALN